MPKTSFITHREIYAYGMMAFELLNAGATYQRMMNKVFSGQIMRNMEVYVDDMIVKSVRKQDHIEDLKECIRTIQRNNMHLNPTKCTFRLDSENFLRYLVNQRCIKANWDKITMVMDMSSPHTLKDVKKLTRRLAALRRFISKSNEKCLPFIDTLNALKKAKQFL